MNLGAGAELGIYSRLIVGDNSTEHWLAETKLNLRMNMELRLNGTVIATYEPNSRQWWITCFNPYYQNVDAGELSVTYTIDFSSHKKMFKDFYRQIIADKQKKDFWNFVKKKYTATLYY